MGQKERHRWGKRHRGEKMAALPRGGTVVRARQTSKMCKEQLKQFGGIIPVWIAIFLAPNTNRHTQLRTACHRLKSPLRADNPHVRKLSRFQFQVATVRLRQPDRKSRPPPLIPEGIPGSANMFPSNIAGCPPVHDSCKQTRIHRTEKKSISWRDEPETAKRTCSRSSRRRRRL